MYRTEKETSKGLKTLLVITFIFFAIFILGFVLFGVNANKTGDVDLKDFGKVFTYHIGNFVNLFTFELNGGSNVFYVALSGLLYGLIALVTIFLIVGVCIAIKKKRAIMVFGIALSVLTLFVYILGATGAPKYWAIITKRGAFETHQQLMVPTFILIISGTLFALFSYITYFACVIEAFKNPGVEDKDAPRKGEQPVMFEMIKNEKPKEEKPVTQKEVPYKAEKIDNDGPLSKKELSELIRGIVRDELNRHTNNNVKCPFVIQKIDAVPTQQVEQIEEKEEPIEEIQAEKKPIIRIPFQVRIMNADEEMKKNYNELKNEILSYGVNSRVSNSGDAFRLHRKTYVKLTIAGLSLKLYFALDPEDYKDSPIPVQDAGHKGIYAEIPLVFKVKSGLSMRRCKQLIETVMKKDGLVQGPIGDIDWVEKIKDQPIEESSEED